MHNGVLENYLELKRFLRERGHIFASDTDTEVVPHLIEEYYEETRSVYESFKRVVKKLKGTYAILMISKYEPDRIFFAKKDSPLVIGVGNGFNLLASDIPAILEHTRRVIVLRDHWIGFITPTMIYIEDLMEEKPVVPERYVRNVEWSVQDAVKGGYPHFMLKEIYEQPRALRETISGIVKDPAVQEALKLVLNAERIYATGLAQAFTP